ncbi:RtcB family protein [Caldicellulosiruptoraceae bacterium PP1]
MEMIKEGIYKNSYATFFMTKDILDTLEEGVFEQAKNASMIPDVEFLGYTPDAHIGKGTSIGTIIVWDMAKAWISPTIVGVDIGCGMRLIKTDYYADNLNKQTLRKLMNEIEEMIPTGVGKKNKKVGLTKTQYENNLFNVEIDKDISDIMDMFEEYDIDTIPKESYDIGIEQFATLGGGNHFIEFQKLNLVDKEIGGKWGLFDGQLVIMVHSGSRRLGSVIGDYYQKKFQSIMEDKHINTPDKHLTFLPIDNKVSRDYIKAMQVAFIYAKLNRHYMSKFIIDILDKNNINSSVLYDVSHNIAYKEVFNNKEKLIIRKGATRALPKGHYLIPSQLFTEYGHPVILPGSMGSFSYILRGIDTNKASYHTVNHGAGRVISRNQARKSISIEDFSKALNQGNEGEILINTRNLKDFIDESPQSYKDINLVIESVITSGLAQVVAKLKPLGVIKGKD